MVYKPWDCEEKFQMGTQAEACLPFNFWVAESIHTGPHSNAKQ